MFENVVVQPFQDSGHTSNPTSSNSPSFTSAQYAEIWKLLGNTNIQPCVEPIVNMAGNVSASLVYKPSAAWIIDGGANENMVGDMGLQHDLKTMVNSNGLVKLPNGSTALVSQLCSVTLSPLVTLRDVLEIPGPKK